VVTSQPRATAKEEPSDDESGGPAVTSQPAASSSVFAVPLPADSNATENTSLNPQDKVTYTPGMTEKASPSHPVGAQPTSQQQSAKW